MFVELMPLLKQRTLLITVARVRRQSESERDSNEGEGRRGTGAHDQLYVQRCEASGSGSEDHAGRSETHLQPSIP